MSEPHAPTTEDLKQRWLEAHRVPASLGSEQIGHLRQQRLAELDAWLDKAKADARREGQADAWDEGSRASRIMLPFDPPRYPTNPYRQEATR